MASHARRVVLPHEEWRALGARRRREIARCARHGRPHPDPYTAAVARAWADEVLRIHGDPADWRAGIATGGWLVLTAWIGAVIGDAAYALLPGSDRAERRSARRIVAVRSPQP